MTSIHKRSSATGIQRKQVTFDTNVILRVHLHLSDITESEKKASWYNEDEIATIRMACCREMVMLNARKRFQRKEYSSEEAILSCNCRGLEYKTKEGSRLRLENRLSAWQVIELEQARQWREGLHDDEKMAEMYHDCTDEATQLAHFMALKDQQWVQEQKFCISIPVKPVKMSQHQRPAHHHMNSSTEQRRCSR